jgi:hypothetical protein
MRPRRRISAFLLAFLCGAVVLLFLFLSLGRTLDDAEPCKTSADADRQWVARGYERRNDAGQALCNVTLSPK